MKKQDLVLRFAGPFGFVKHSGPLLFEQPVAQEPGLYLWTVPYRQGGYLVTYVGETGASFSQRFRDHLIQTVSGNYRIWDPDLQGQGKVLLLWHGLWQKGTREKLPEYLDRLEEFAPIIRKRLQTEAVFVAPLRSERRLRQRVEGAIAEHIKAQPAPVSSLLPSDIRYYRRRADEEPVTVVIECRCHVHGLPRTLEV
jgi:hypothetical protein